jgi:site-specific recombinase XerC
VKDASVPRIVARNPLPAGIRRAGKGWRAFVRVRYGIKGSKLLTKRFPRTATLTEMKAWREEQRVLARKIRGPIPERGTFAADIERYLKQVAAMPTITWRRRDLQAWREAWGDFERTQISAEMIRGQLQAWRAHGPVLRYVPRTKEFRKVDRPLSASACNHRRTALLHLWTLLDGKDAPNPVRAVRPFDEPAPAPRAVDIEFLEAAISRMQNAKDRARAGVLLWTGIRGNSELSHMKAEHVKLEAGECHVPTGKGGKRFRFVPLNAKGIAAWEAFAAARAWGPYNKDLLRKAFQRACRAEQRARDPQNTAPARVRVYDLRHSVATAYLRAGADLADVQDLLGHTTPRMTRRYAPLQRLKLVTAAKRLE